MIQTMTRSHVLFRRYHDAVRDAASWEPAAAGAAVRGGERTSSGGEML